MANWRFYQGLRNEWRWYHLDEAGDVISESDQGFEELPACMANAEFAGFTGNAYQVHMRSDDDAPIVQKEQSRKETGISGTPSQDWKGSPPGDSGPRRSSAE